MKHEIVEGAVAVRMGTFHLTGCRLAQRETRVQRYMYQDNILTTFTKAFDFPSIDTRRENCNNYEASRWRTFS